MGQIILNDLDIEKDAQFREFLDSGDAPVDKKFLIRPSRQFTDAEYEGLFTKIAELKPCENFDEYKDVIHNVFDGKLDKQLGRWEEKLALDRTRLNEIFGKKQDK